MSCLGAGRALRFGCALFLALADAMDLPSGTAGRVGWWKEVAPREGALRICVVAGVSFTRVRSRAAG